MKKMMSLCALVVLAAVVFSGCSGNSAGNLDAIKKKGEISIFTNPTFPPYEFLGKDGKVIGVEIDIAEKVAAKIGVKLVVKSAEFDGIIAAIASGKADMGVSGFTITEERKQKIDFSIPYVTSVQYLIIKEGSAIKTLNDLAGKNIGGQQGTTGYLMVEDQINKGFLKDTKTTIRPYISAPDAVVNLKEGRVDAVVIDDLVAKQLAGNNPGLVAIEMAYKDGAPEKEEFAFVFKKGTEPLRAIVDEVMKEMLKDGSLDASFKKNEDIAKEVENNN